MVKAWWAYWLTLAVGAALWIESQSLAAAMGSGLRLVSRSGRSEGRGWISSPVDGSSDPARDSNQQPGDEHHSNVTDDEKDERLAPGVHGPSPSAQAS
jgi:hypothetical protein